MRETLPACKNEVKKEFDKRKESERRNIIR